MARETPFKIVQTILINAAPYSIVPDQGCGRNRVWKLIDCWIDNGAQVVDGPLDIPVHKQNLILRSDHRHDTSQSNIYTLPKGAV